MAWGAADAKGIYDAQSGGGPSTSELATGSTEQHGVNVALSRLIWVEHEVESFFEANGFIGAEKDMSKIIWKKVDLVKGRGETIYMLMRAKLTDSTGITGDSVLFGNEESLSYGYQSITINQLRHAVALDGAMTEKRFIGDLRKDAKDALKVWMAEILDSKLFTTLAASLSRVLYPGSASSTATVSSVDLMDLATIAKARALAVKKRIKGIKHKGKMYYVLILSPDQAYDLQTNAAEAGFSWETLQKDAASRGDGNRLFTGALGLYMGVLLYSHESIPTATTWGSGGDVAGATALFLGAAAGCRAFGGYVDTGSPVKAVEEKHDYGNVFATAIGTIFGDKKTNYTLSGSSSPLFNEDYAVIGIRTARTNITEGT